MLEGATKKRKDTKLDAVKVPPYSLEAEQAVLGSLMLDNKAWDKIANRLTGIDFYRHEHRLIFQAFSELACRHQPFDVLTIAEALKSVQKLEAAGGETYLFELANNTPSAANVAAYVAIVRERSIFRQLLEVSHDLAELVFNPEGRLSQEVLDEAERRIFKIAEQEYHNQGPISFSGLLGGAVEHIDALYHAGSAITGLATGFKDFDELTSGLQKGDLVIVAGRPSMGKTALAMNIAEHIALQQQTAKEKKPVLVFSMEMPGQQLAVRMLSSNGRINQQKVRTGKLIDEDWRRITSAVGLLSEAPIFVDDSPALTPAEIRARARRLVREHGELSLMIVDYLQLMRVGGGKENRATEISEISRSLKALAKELNIPIIALSQLNRSLEQRNDKRPVMSDLRESGSIEQDADLIAFIYRDEVYNENTSEKGIAEIIIAKQRNGPIGKVRLTFLGKYTRFENYSSPAFVGDEEYL